MKFLQWCSLVLFFSATAHAQGAYPFGPGGAPTWQFAVPSVAALPAGGNTVGDARFETTAFGLYVWDGLAWQAVSGGGGGVASVSIAAANGFTGTSSGGANPALTIIASGCNGVCKSNGTAISTAAASDITGQLLTGFVSGAGVVAATDTILQAFNKLVGNAAAYLSNTLASGNIFVGSAGNVATSVTMSGDAAIIASGAITVNTVGTSSAANIHSAELAANAATAVPTASTISKWDASSNMLANAFFASTYMDFTQIATPANPVAGHDRCYVKADDKFYCLSSAGVEVLVGPGAGVGTVTTVSVVATNGFDGTVANPTTTPAITIKTTLGAGLVSSDGASAIVSATSADVTGKLLTGFSAGAGVVAATDTILQAFNKIVGNAAAYLSNTLASGNIFVGSAGNVATGVAMSGDATISNTGVVSLTNASVTGQPITGFSAGAGVVAATDTILQAFNKLAGNQAGFLPTAGTGLVEANSADIPVPINDTYPLEQKAAYAYTINSVNIATTSGTITADFKINGVVITGCNAIAVTSANSANACTAANSVAIGDTVTLVTTANAASTHLSFTVKETRQ